MVRTVFLTFISCCFLSIISYAQVDLSTIASPDGEPHISSATGPFFLREPHLTRSDQIQNLDPGISPEGDYMGQVHNP